MTVNQVSRFSIFLFSLAFYSSPAWAGTLKISHKKFEDTFFSDNLFHYEGDDTDASNRPFKTYRAKTRHNSMSVYVSGETITEISMLCFSPGKGKLSEEDQGYLKLLFSVASPQWSDGVSWLTKKLAEMDKQQQAKSTTKQGNLSLTIDYDASFGMVKLTLR